jgi:hypothetical protein
MPVYVAAVRVAVETLLELPGPLIIPVGRNDAGGDAAGSRYALITRDPEFKVSETGYFKSG